MRKIKEALRLKAAGLSCRAIARSCLIGKERVREYLGRAAAADPDWTFVHGELRKKGVTYQLLWEEYRLGFPGGYSYSQYCERYRRWIKS